MNANAANITRVGAHDTAIAEFGERLAAGAAWAEPGMRSNTGDGLEFPVTFADRFADCDPLGADRQTVAGVFHVRAGVDFSAFGEERGADAKL